ncbi:MAG TPA: right-handed parallel beta-helix repeat-containing protein [Kofleriaceae bacterium]|nr:right-handed parallel beta-helix repeat-containing protein [Kofleriaceae bacterium]
MGKSFVSTLRLASLLLPFAAACGEVKETPDPGADAATPPTDSADAPGTVVLVAPTGSDTSDGLAQPVRTLKRALAIAATNPAITKVTLQAGRYDAPAGETFPYVVPGPLVISGPAGGGAVLAGDGSTAALTLGGATLVDIELEGFTVAITATGGAELTNVHVRDSGTAIRGEAGARLTATALDLTGTASACQHGVELVGDARLDVATLDARGLGTLVTASDTSTVSLAGANVTGEPACGVMLDIKTSGALAISDSSFVGGGTGISFLGAATPTQATLTNTVIRSMKSNGMAGRTVALVMTGGELSNNARGGFEASGGSWTLTNVAIKQNAVMGIYLQGGTSPGNLKLRGCTVTANGTGVYLFDNAFADLGTDADPGANTLQGNFNVGLDVDGFAGAHRIDAVGNVWRPSVQGADAAGKYSVATVAGPVDGGSAGNFSINSGWSLRR